MIKCETRDKTKDSAELVTVTIGNGTTMSILREFSSICGELRNRLYENGYTEEKVHDALFAAFKLGVEDNKFYPYSTKAKEAINKNNEKKPAKQRELPTD